MKTYTLKLKTTSTVNYNLYDGTTLVSDSNLSTLFGSAGEAYFVFDFNSLTPTNTTSLTILDSQDTAVITNTGLTGIAENKNFKGTWSASATAFDSFTLLQGVAMDEAQLSRLAALAKAGASGGDIFVVHLTDVNANYPVESSSDIKAAIDAGKTILLKINSIASVGICIDKNGYNLKFVYYELVVHDTRYNDFYSVSLSYTSGTDKFGVSRSKYYRVSPQSPSSIAGIASDQIISSQSLKALLSGLDEKAVGTTESVTIADTDWSALSSSDPYTYSATKTLTTTIGANSTVSLINDSAVDFATYGFAIGSVDQPNNAITFYSIGAPSASKSLTINIKG